MYPMLLASLAVLLLPASIQPPILEAEVQAIDMAAGWVQVSIPPGATLSKETELVLAAELQPVGRFRLSEQDSRRATFSRKQAHSTFAFGRLRAWLVWPSLLRRLCENWPEDADLVAAIERVGPEARCVWINAGTSGEIQPGMSWWARVGGQPVARFDTLSVERDACFCSVVRLAASAGIRRDDRVTLWPSPGQRRTGAAISAVSYVERGADRTIVWVAAPRGVETPPEPHLDFFHEGEYVAHAVVESTDDLFWYGRLVEGGSRGLPDRPQAQVAVGDLAVIRTQADIAARRFAARVFDVTPDGVIINAGEADGISLGEAGSIYRSGVKIGHIRITRLQRSYSVAEPYDPLAETRATGDSQQPAPIQKLLVPVIVPVIGDLVRFSDPPPAPISLAEVDGVVDKNLFSARALAHVEIPALAPLLVRTTEAGNGVALVLASDGERVCGLVLENSLAAPLRAGTLLQYPADDAAAQCRDDAP